MQSFRAICWLLGIGSVLLVVVGYDALPHEFPVSRWMTLPKTPFLAVRVPLINLASLGLIDLLTSNARRDTQAISQPERNITLCLLATVAAKIVVETFEILVLKHFQSPAFTYGLVALVLLRLSGSGYFFTRLEPARRELIFKTDATKAVAMGLLLVGIVALNLPLLRHVWAE